MDSRLKNAIDQGRQDAADAKAIEMAKEEAKRQKEKEYILSKVPAAREFLDNWLFKEIAKIEASGSNYRRIELSNHMSIPNEALYKAAQEIEGIKTGSDWHFTGGYEDQSGEGYRTYYVTWE